MYRGGEDDRQGARHWRAIWCGCHGGPIGEATTGGVGANCEAPGEYGGSGLVGHVGHFDVILCRILEGGDWRPSEGIGIGRHVGGCEEFHTDRSAATVGL